MRWLSSLFRRRVQRPTDVSSSQRGLGLVPILCPSTWPGADGNECCRKLVGADSQPDQDPWVALALDRDTHFQALPPGGLAVLGEVLERSVSLESAETLACALLDDRFRAERLAIHPLAADAEIRELVYEDLAASLVLLPHMLAAVQASLRTDALFVAIPTRASIYFAGTPAGALKLFEIIAAVHTSVPVEAHLSSSVFMAHHGKVVGMGRDVQAMQLTFART